MPKPEIKLLMRAGSLIPEAIAMKGAEEENPQRVLELAQRAAGIAIVRQVAHRVLGCSLETTTKDGLMRAGHAFWRHTYKGTDSDEQAISKYYTFVNSLPDPFGEIVCGIPDALIYVAAARWADQAFPTITMSERYCAALLGTDVPEVMLADIKSPWRAFCIEVPNGLLDVFDPEEQVRTRVTRVLVQSFQTETEGLTWGWIAFSENDQHLWRQGTAEQIIKPVKFGDQQAEVYKVHAGEDAFGEHVSHDERVYLLVSRLVLNVILAMTSPDNMREVGSSHTRWKNRQARGNERSGPPEQRVFHLGHTIKLDCRHAVREYLAGSRAPSKLAVQTLVRGYWRSQPYGPKHALRRPQWIEPYWKGPEEAPINMRDHNLG